MGQMTHKIPNDRDERLEFLKQLHKFRKEIQEKNIQREHRTFEKQHLKPLSLKKNIKRNSG